jgi:ABC-2 type transport system ATP-binding protein
MIKIKDITKIYNGKKVVDIKNLEIRPGEIIGLVGKNGAGKTTFFRLLLDLVKPDKGEVLINDLNVSHTDEWKKFTTSYLDEDFLISYLTPIEYLSFIGSLNNISDIEINRFITTNKKLFDETITNQKYIRDLSKGSQCKVGIAGALAVNPKICILDEPFANLDPSSQIQLKNLLLNINLQYGTTLFISSHDLNHVTSLCKRILIMENGEIMQDLLVNKENRIKIESYFIH